MKDVPKAIEAVWKTESTRLIAAIARVTYDIGTTANGEPRLMVAINKRTSARRPMRQRLFGDCKLVT